MALQLRDIADRLWLHSLGWRPPAEEAVFAQLTADAVRLAGRIADLDPTSVAEPGRGDERRNETEDSQIPGQVKRSLDRPP